ncbi:hypothetical protein SAMN06269185_1663 [Natronoarchaeum philippinense]|uniref:Uncharacterized protein n=1 Tax=Natronoarchaeum philippinense TaxID=558529 RepID=A0A285NXJ5_NATPI|nr:hypothetical protein [Natronoarchaeum philippinense]SNZ12371.1 hypothetical protein SAMN06269185_1663 [Natronoarchaeum philippinense]
MAETEDQSESASDINRIGLAASWEVIDDLGELDDHEMYGLGIATGYLQSRWSNLRPDDIERVSDEVIRDPLHIPEEPNDVEREFIERRDLLAEAIADLKFEGKL